MDDDDDDCLAWRQSCSDGEYRTVFNNAELNNMEAETKEKLTKKRDQFRKTKSLGNIKPNDYTLGEIRRLHERLAAKTPKGFNKKSWYKSLTRGQILALICLCVVDFISFCSMSILAPFFPKEANHKGMSESMSALVFSFYAFIIFVSSPVIGKLTPVVGAKFLFLAGLFVAGSCNLLFGLLSYIVKLETFIIFCFIVRGFEALGASAYTTATYVFVVEVFPENVGAVLGVLETFVGLGMSTGPALGGLLYTLGGFGLPFYSLGVILVLTVPLTMYFLPSLQQSVAKPKSNSLKRVLKTPKVVLIGIVIINISAIWSFLDPTLEPHLRQLNLTPEKIGLIFLLFSAIYGLSSPLWGWVSDKYDNHWLMMVIGLLISSAALLILGPMPFFTGFQSSIMSNLVALTILGASVSLCLLPTFQSILEAAVENGCRDELATYSLVAGTWSSMYALGEVLGPLIGGVLTEHFGFPICCTVIAAFSAFLSLISTIYFLLRPSNILDGNKDEYSNDSGYTKSSDEDETMRLLV